MAVSHESPRVKITYREYLLFPEDGNRHEIIDGRHYMNPAPAPRHQTVSRLLQFQLMQQLESPGLAQVFNAPIDVKLTDTDVVQPDLAVVANGNKIVTEKLIDGAPDLVVEILSPSTRERDLKLKKLLYAQSGIAEYWIVDPQDDSITRFTINEQGGYSQSTRHTETIESNVAGQDVVVDLPGVWKS